MPNSGDIDSALLAYLGSDAQLLALCPNGAYYGEAPPGMTRFVIVQMLTEFDEGVFQTRAIEDALVMVEARGLIEPGKPQPNMKAAAARIDELLEGGTLTVAGYNTMHIHREERIRDIEVDDENPDIRWDRRGGHYRVQMSLVGA